MRLLFSDHCFSSFVAREAHRYHESLAIRAAYITVSPLSQLRFGDAATCTVEVDFALLNGGRLEGSNS